MYHDSKSWPVPENGKKYDRMTTFDRTNCLFFKYSSIFKHQAEKINKLVWTKITTTLILKWPKISGRMDFESRTTVCYKLGGTR